MRFDLFESNDVFGDQTNKIILRRSPVVIKNVIYETRFEHRFTNRQRSALQPSRVGRVAPDTAVAIFASNRGNGANGTSSDVCQAKRPDNVGGRRNFGAFDRRPAAELQLCFAV